MVGGGVRSGGVWWFVLRELFVLFVVRWSFRRVRGGE